MSPAIPRKNSDRDNPRAIVRFPTHITEQEGSEEIFCMVLDISVSGIRILLSPNDDLKKKLEIKMSLLPNVTLYLEAKRVWRAGDLAGLHFENLSRKNFLVLSSLVKIHRAEVSQQLE